MGEGEDPESRENRGGRARLKGRVEFDVPPVSKAARFGVVPTPNKQLQPTVIPNRMRAASAPFHYAPAARQTRGHAAAEQQALGAREPDR